MEVKNQLLARSTVCELCADRDGLEVFHVPPVQEKTADRAVLLCKKCLTLIEDPTKNDPHHWHCLGTSVWSEFPAVQVLAWRLLKKMSDQDWAQTLLDQVYLDEATQEWAISTLQSQAPETDVTPTKDSNGNVLRDGDAVTLIKDLEVKGAGFTAKRGTVVKNISLSSNPAHIEGRVNGTQIVLLTCFLKKAN